MTSTISSNRRGWARNSDWICTPLRQAAKKSPNRLKASSGARGVGGVQQARGQAGEQLAAPLGAGGGDMAVVPAPDGGGHPLGMEKPMRLSVARVSGSSSTPVNTRLPKREDSSSSPLNSAP
jgi:hypothetical protein